MWDSLYFPYSAIQNVFGMSQEVSKTRIVRKIASATPKDKYGLGIREWLVHRQLDQTTTIISYLM